MSASVTELATDGQDASLPTWEHTRRGALIRVAVMVTRKKQKPPVVKPKPPKPHGPVYLYIKEWMDELGHTDITLGKILGIDRATVFRWRTEQKRLTPPKIVRLADALKLKPIDLWRRPSIPSVDAILDGAPIEQYKMAVDIVQRLIQGHDQRLQEE